MPDAVDMHNPLVVVVPHLTPAGALAGTHAGLAPAHLVLEASGGRATLSLPSQALLHRIMWHEEHNAAQNVLMQQLSGGKDKYASVRLHQTWLPNDPAVVGQLTSCGQVDSAFESNSEFAIYQYLVATRTSHKNANTLLRIVTHPNFVPMALRFQSIEAYHCRVDALQQDGMLYKSMHEAIDSDQIVDFFSDKVWTWQRKSFRALPPASTARGRSRQPLNPRQVKEPTGNSWQRAGLS